MAAIDQCALCLSCGAPFMPSVADVKLFGRRANMSVLYIDDRCSNHEELRRLFETPRFTGPRQAAHMFHTAAHSQAILYMSKHHKGDDGPPTPVTNARLPALNGAFPFFKSDSKNMNPRLACWPQPPAAERVDLTPLLNHILTNPGVLDVNFADETRVMYPTCKWCNLTMTQLSYMRYIVGFCSNADRNPFGCVIEETFAGIESYEANIGAASTADVAYGVWRRKGARGPDLYPRRTGVEDPTAPHIAYYLHLCLPHQANPAVDVFDALGPSKEAGRITYTQMSWLLLVIACIATQIEQGTVYKQHRLSHGMHQHYGALDLYVSFFFWRLMNYEYARDLARMGVDFVQWHQKYFWEAVHLPGIGARDHIVVGLAAYSTVKQPARPLLEDICERLMSLYQNQMRPLIALVTGNMPVPVPGGVALTPAQDFVRRFFVSPASLRRLRALGTQYIKEDDFDSALTAVGVHAMLARVMRLCNVEMLPLLSSFRRAWATLEIDRVRLGNGDGLTMRSASVLVTLCRLLDPPMDLPQDKLAANAIMRGARCSVWNAVLAQHELGAFMRQRGEGLLPAP
jgi:hypothetical protein